MGVQLIFVRTYPNLLNIYDPKLKLDLLYTQLKKYFFNKFPHIYYAKTHYYRQNKHLY